MLSGGLKAALLGPPGWVRALNPGGAVPSLALDFANGRYWTGQVRGSVDAIPGWTFSRTGVETDLATGAIQFATGVPAILPGLGLQAYEARTNSFASPTAPATQSISIGATGTYIVTLIGSGSATSSAGTATGSGFGAATAGSPNVFTITGTGTVTITISGSPTYVNVQLGAFATPIIPLSASTRGAAVAKLATTLPTAFAVRFNASRLGSSGAARVLDISDAGINNRVSLFWNGGGSNLGLDIVSGGSTVASLNLGALSANADYVLAVRLAVGDVAASLSGASVVTGAPASLPAVTTLNIGSDFGNGSQLEGSIKRIATFAASLNNAQLQALGSGF